MTTRTLFILIACVFAIFFAGVFTLSQYEHGAETPSFIAPESVSVSREYSNSMHTLRGTLTVPTACYKESHTVTVAESFPEQVTIDMTVSPISEHCIMTPTQLPFSFAVSVSPEATFRMRINGEPVTLAETNTPVVDNAIEAPEGSGVQATNTPQQKTSEVNSMDSTDSTSSPATSIQF